MPAVNTEALAERGETWIWKSAAAGVSGDWVLASGLSFIIKSKGVLKVTGSHLNFKSGIQYHLCIHRLMAALMPLHCVKIW